MGTWIQGRGPGGLTGGGSGLLFGLGRGLRLVVAGDGRVEVERGLLLLLFLLQCGVERLRDEPMRKSNLYGVNSAVSTLRAGHFVRVICYCSFLTASSSAILNKLSCGSITYCHRKSANFEIIFNI